MQSRSTAACGAALGPTLTDAEMPGTVETLWRVGNLRPHHVVKGFALQCSPHPRAVLGSCGFCVWECWGDVGLRLMALRKSGAGFWASLVQVYDFLSSSHSCLWGPAHPKGYQDPHHLLFLPCGPGPFVWPPSPSSLHVHRDFQLPLP